MAAFQDLGTENLAVFLDAHADCAAGEAHLGTFLERSQLFRAAAARLRELQADKDARASVVEAEAKVYNQIADLIENPPPPGEALQKLFEERRAHHGSVSESIAEAIESLSYARTLLLRLSVGQSAWHTAMDSLAYLVSLALRELRALEDAQERVNPTSP